MPDHRVERDAEQTASNSAGRDRERSGYTLPQMRASTPRRRLLYFLNTSILLISLAACGIPLSSQRAAQPAVTSRATVIPFGAATAAVADAAVGPATATMPPPPATAATATDGTLSPTSLVLTATSSPTAATLAPTEVLPPTSIPTPEIPTPTVVPPLDPAIAAELQRVLDETVADGYIPGAVLAVTIPGYQPWGGASGVADRQQGLPMEPATRVRIASLSKIFTAVTVLLLVEEGRINLDAPIATALPGLLAKGDRITPRQLLNHRTGLYDFLEDRNFLTQAYLDPNRVFAPAELVAYAEQFAPMFEPGTPGAWDYSSTNFVILGMLVEQVTGRSLAQEMRERIFAPLGLEHTFFAPDEPIVGQARGYSREIDQTNVAMSFAFATANLVSSADDVRRFAEALFGGRLLKPETLSAMYGFVSGYGQYNMPALEYGLGLMRNQLPVGPAANGLPRPPEVTTVLGHIGGFGGFRSALWHAPESGITIALSVNQAAMDPNTLATSVFDTILTLQGR